MTKLGKTVKASLIYCGRDVGWLAERLGLDKATIYRRLKDDHWSLIELREMQKIFKWPTLEG